MEVIDCECCDNTTPELYSTEIFSMLEYYYNSGYTITDLLDMLEED